MRRLFRIRPRQLRVFEQNARQAFEDRAVEHVRRMLPEPSASLTDDVLRALIRGCGERASTYGLGSERQVMCYLDATVLLGDRFEAQPEHEWAMKVLRSEKLSRPDAAALLLATSCSVYRARQEAAESTDV